MVGTHLRKTISHLKRDRHFVATGLVVHDSLDKVLLIKHKKLKTWLPPGGHVDEGELPDECVIREVFEETGLIVEIISEAFDVSHEKVETLHTPLLVQLEKIESLDSEHQHVDLQYLCKVIGGELNASANEEHDEARWFNENELKAFQELQADVRENAFKALDKARELRKRGSF